MRLLLYFILFKRDHFPLALSSVTLETRAAEKIGIVGRTGSGKTTLFQILFRLVDLNSGEILIDDVNIQSLGLSDLRLFSIKNLFVLKLNLMD